MVDELISVLITTYNHEKYIEHCINSILKQTNVEFEIIVHDDNSSDETLKILKNFSSNCKIVENDSGFNLGVSNSFNKILKLAKGDYIAMMSGDDAWHENKLEKQLKLLKENKSIDICFTDSLTIDDEGNFSPRQGYFETNNYNRINWIYRLLLGNCLLAPSCLIRKNSWIIQNPLRETLHQLQDWDLWIRAVCAGINISILNEPLTYYRVLESSISNSMNPEKYSRVAFETQKCLESFLSLPLADMRAIFAPALEDNKLFIKDRSVDTGLAIILSKIDSSIYQRAAADILFNRYKSQISMISNIEYHNFIGSLKLT